MLRESDFKTLARYYDLTGSDIPISDLESGEFFVRKERPEVAHPAAFWRYKHPFAPGFAYAGMQPGDRDDVYTIRVSISIDQGYGAPEQIGYSQFYMIRSVHGWQVLPDRVEEGGQLPVSTI